ncbi:hypothetical protein ACI4BE_29185, partial [Klebsiella pneumoniae]|uniref:hypothetical protein n=1 Tax=Klebsiella pneumoniae TaxID=573 RepID=UPI0038543EF5
KLDLSALGIGDFETLATLLTQVGNDAVLRADPGGLYFPGMETTVTLQGVSVAALLASHASIRLAPSGTPAEAIARAYGNVVYGSS